MRNIYVLGVSLFLGISIPQYFVMNTDVAGHGPVRTNGGWVIIMHLCIFFIFLKRKHILGVDKILLLLQMTNFSFAYYVRIMTIICMDSSEMYFTNYIRRPEKVPRFYT